MGCNSNPALWERQAHVSLSLASFFGRLRAVVLVPRVPILHFFEIETAYSLATSSSSLRMPSLPQAVYLGKDPAFKAVGVFKAPDSLGQEERQSPSRVLSLHLFDMDMAQSQGMSTTAVVTALPSTTVNISDLRPPTGLHCKDMSLLKRRKRDNPSLVSQAFTLSKWTLRNTGPRRAHHAPSACRGTSSSSRRFYSVQSSAQGCELSDGPHWT